MTVHTTHPRAERRRGGDAIRYAAAVLAATAATVLVAACGSGSTSAPGAGAAKAPAASAIPAAHVNPAARALLPAAIRSKGTLVVGTSADYAPLEFVATNGHTIIGMDADLAKAIGQVLGVKVTMVNGTFDSLIPGLAANRFNVVMAGMNDYKAREKVVNFTDYFSAGTSFYEKASGAPAITSLASLCGHSVAVESGTSEETDANKQKAACAKAGKPAVNVLVFQDQNAANLALASGRAEVGMADSPVAGYIVAQSHGQFKLAGQPYGTVPDGIATPKTSGLAQPMLAAVKALISDGIYAKILAKWGVQAGALTAPQINGAAS